MTFLNPNILWGLLAIIIPIIIHLFNFRRVKKLYFSNISLLKTVNTQAKTFLKLKHWLVLASRMLFIACLVFAFAQPYFPSKSGINKDGQSITSVYLDNSTSMQNETDNKSAINTAIKKIERLAMEMPKSAKNQFITNDFSANEFKNYNPNQLKNQASKTELSTSIRSIPEVYTRQQSLIEKNTNSLVNNVFMFSDFQKSTSGNIAAIGKASQNNIYLIPSGIGETHNVFVDSVWLDSPFIRKMQPNKINVKLANSGNNVAKNIAIKLHLGELHMNAIPTKIDPNGSTIVQFEVNINQNGFQKGRISFDDSPILFDNEYYFVLDASPIINIIHFKGSTVDNNYLKNVFANDSLFNYTAFSLQNVDFGLIKNADLLIVEGAQNFSSNLENAIKIFLNNGGNILVIPSKNLELNSYNSILNTYGISNIRLNTTNEPAALAEPEKQIGFFKDIFENTKIKETMLMPTASIVLNYNTMGQILLKTKGNQPYLSISKSNKGTVYFMAAPLAEGFSNFGENALFVPIMYKIASSSIKSSALAYRFDERAITFDGKNYNDKTLIKLKKDGVDIIPVQKVVGNELYIEMPKPSELTDNKSLQPGYFELFNGKNRERLLAINHSNVESKMNRYTAAELKLIFANNKKIKIIEQENATDFLMEFNAQNQGTYLWKYCIIAALIFLALETLLIRLWK